MADIQMYHLQNDVDNHCLAGVIKAEDFRDCWYIWYRLKQLCHSAFNSTELAFHVKDNMIQHRRAVGAYLRSAREEPSNKPEIQSFLQALTYFVEKALITHDFECFTRDGLSKQSYIPKAQENAELCNSFFEWSCTMLRAPTGQPIWEWHGHIKRI
jgi:hypothetical protein